MTLLLKDKPSVGTASVTPLIYLSLLLTYQVDSLTGFRKLNISPRSVRGEDSSELRGKQDIKHTFVTISLYGRHIYLFTCRGILILRLRSSFVILIRPVILLMPLH